MDMDGTIYIENKLIPGAKEFLLTLKKQGKDFVFLTNNSSKGAQKYLDKLNKLGIEININNIFTSGQATSIYLQNKKKGATLFVVGTESFKSDLINDGFNVVERIDNRIDTLVVGFDTELTYSKIEKACELIDRGLDYIATNPDLVCPIKNRRFIPDCGSICEMLENATGRKPFYIGKPRKEMIEIIIERRNIQKHEMAIIGDRLYTDIACGINAGISTISVLTGETKITDINKSEYQPDYVVESIMELYKFLKI